MNTECMYILCTGKDVDEAKRIVKELNREAKELNHELYPSFIGKAVKDFFVHTNYDGDGERYLVTRGQTIIFASGKLHSMYELWPDGVMIGFPYKLNAEYFPDRVEELVKDLYEYNDETDEFMEIGDNKEDKMDSNIKEAKVILDYPLYVRLDSEIGLIRLYDGDDYTAYKGEFFVDEIERLQKEDFIGGIALIYEDDEREFVKRVLDKSESWRDKILEATKRGEKIKFLSPWEMEAIKNYKGYGRKEVDRLLEFFHQEGGYYTDLV